VRRTDDGLEMTLEELTLSAWRAWCAVTGTEIAFEDLDHAEQARWLGALRWARLCLPGYDGKRVSEAVDGFLAQYADGDPQLHRQQDAYRVEWEAVVRHVCVLIDSDELADEDDVRGLEQSWAAWLTRRPRRVVEGT